MAQRPAPKRTTNGGGESAEVTQLPPAHLKISVYRRGSHEISHATTIAGNAMAMAEKLLPEKARTALAEKGVCLDDLAQFARSPHARGATILVHDDLKKNEKIVISLV